MGARCTQHCIDSLQIAIAMQILLASNSNNCDFFSVCGNGGDNGGSSGSSQVYAVPTVVLVVAAVSTLF